MNKNFSQSLTDPISIFMKKILLLVIMILLQDCKLKEKREKLEGLPLSGQDMRKWKLKNAEIRNCNLKLANLSFTDLSRAQFELNDMWQANLQGARLNCASFRDCNLIVASFRGADLSHATITNSTSDDHWGLFNTDFTNSNLADAFIKIEAMTLDINAYFFNANLRRAKFYGCHIKASFAGANLQGADFQGADLQNSDFQGANLKGANFCRADIRGCRFEGANLKGAILPSSDYCKGADFRNANLSGAFMNYPSSDTLECSSKFKIRRVFPDLMHDAYTDGARFDSIIFFAPYQQKLKFMFNYGYGGLYFEEDLE
jgi:uncharacterized protein YjbI with pentapeptide repeats